MLFGRLPYHLVLAFIPRGIPMVLQDLRWVGEGGGRVSGVRMEVSQTRSRDWQSGL